MVGSPNAVASRCDQSRVFGLPMSTDRNAWCSETTRFGRRWSRNAIIARVSGSLAARGPG